MASRLQFEQDLKNKLEQKATVHSGAENVLMKSFKYFDLDNTGTVDLQEFVKAIEKIGVVVQSVQQLEELFKYYDTSGDGVLDYNEFAAIVFGNQSATTRKFSPQKTVTSTEQLKIEKALENFRQKLASRGARGMIGLQRSFKIMDDDDSKSLDIYEFTKAVKDYRIDVPETEIQILFNAFDVDRNGTLSYDEFLRAVRGPMNAFRKSLVSQAFKKLDKDGSGVIDINDIRDVYNAKFHPDVKQGKKTEEEVLLEFLETFEMHHNIAGGTQGDHVVDFDEWLEYYNNVSASIDNDEYFQLMMTNSWRLNEQPPAKKGELIATKSMKEAFGKQPVSSLAKVPPQAKQTAPQEPQQIDNKSLAVLFEKFRQKLISRGARGITGLQRQFKIMDDNHSLTLDRNEFIKAIKDFRVDIPESELGKLFDAFDRDGSGELSYDEFLRSVRGPMNQFRKSLVHRAFKKLDKDGSGIIDINDVKGVYNAKHHPDVKAGKRTEDDVLGDFLETFEMHHNISDKARNDHNITLEEFEEYYNNVSMSVGKFLCRR